MMKQKRALVLDGNTRQVLPIIKGLHEKGYHVTTICDSKLDEGYTSRYADQRIIAHYDKILLDVYEVTKKEVQSGKYSLLFPLTDETMDMVTKHANEFVSYVNMPIPKREVFMRAFDKQNTMDICMDNKIPCPITKRKDEPLNLFVEKIGFPLIAKPRSDSGSMGLKIINNQKELDLLVDKGMLDWDKYLIQECIPLTGKQYNAHMFVDRDGTICTSLMTEKCRWFPVDGGASCLSRTIQDEKINSICDKLMNVIGWEGYCDIDLIEDPRTNEIKVIEINGRASANIKICVLAGVDIVSQMIDFSLGKKVNQTHIEAKEVRLRCILTDCLWFLKSKERFSKRPSWFNITRTRDQIFSIKDPIPFFAFIALSVPKYRSEMKKRSRK